MNKALLLVFAALLFLAHAFEEYLFGFHRTDTILKWFSEMVSISPVVVWLLVQIIIFIFLLVLYVVRDNPNAKALWFILLIVFVVELSHLLTALTHQSYAPGLITSLLFVPLGWLIYKQLHRS